MNEELDVNKMATEFVSQNIERFYNTGKDIFKGAADSVRLRLNSSYRDYLETIASRHSKGKSFFIRNEPTNLYDFYIPIGITSEKQKIDKASVGAISLVNPFSVITGGGGSGKSMLMRHLLLDAIKQKQKVPIFLELRELNQSEQSLLDFVKESLRINGFTLDDEYIEKALKAGHFALLFDGFDEVSLSLRDKVRKQLFQITKHYDQNAILVSSRPDNEFSGWPAFTVFKIDELTLDQACELIEKLPFDVDLKTKFLKDLRGGLYQKHNSFLSNPLLLSIMLLTYSQSADIPTKLSIFYSQAYEALFQRHDALKAGFKRERLTKLDIQDFGKVFAAFCIQTYDQRAFRMDKSQALEYLEKSKKILNLDFNANDYLVDAQQAVCLLIEDGLQLAFSHRSFQEYFAARFIYHLKPDIQRQIIDKNAEYLLSDNVMQLLFEMSPELVERDFLIPRLTRLQQVLKVKRKVGITHFLRFMQLSKVVFRFSKQRGLIPDFINITDILLIQFVLMHYKDEVNYKGLIYIDFDSLNHGTKSRKISMSYLEQTKRQVSVTAAELSTRDELVKYVATYGNLFSIAALQAAFDAKSMIIKKHETQSSSLDAILGLG
jgi:hypothetical protein